MGYLLDTHALLWYLLRDPNLSQPVKDIIDTKTGLYFSVASLWEISIKVNIGKLQINQPFEQLFDELNFLNTEVIPISPEDLKTFTHLPPPTLHRDPFDRMLISQAITRNLTVLSRDTKFRLYPVSVIWF
jgi:PIN domain nuclease of toxin-antitoxin system